MKVTFSRGDGDSDPERAILPALIYATPRQTLDVREVSVRSDGTFFVMLNNGRFIEGCNRYAQCQEK